MTMFRLLPLLCLIFPATVMAEEGALLYNRERIALTRHGMPSLPWQASGAAAASPPLTFEVEVRDAAALRHQQGWFDLGGLSENGGMLMVFSASGLPPVARSTQYAPLDILFIDQEGKITQILPDLVLAKLEREIYPDAPVLAFLFLKGGMCKKLSIAPGDEVDYKIFRKPPVMLNAPAPSLPPAQ